jgi:SAM-dependent methyltransferase
MAHGNSGNSRTSGILSALCGRWYRYLRPSEYQDYAITRTASRYDMTSAPSEQYYADVYLGFIRNDLRSHFGSGNLAILDAGCGQGRISLPLAADGNSVTGLDLSSDAIGMARRYAEESGHTIEYHVADLNSLDLEIRPECRYDCIICLEVLYLSKDPWKIIRSFLNHLKKDGLLIVSLRTQYYYQLQAVLANRMDDPVFDRASEGGYVNGLYFNWVTREKWISACDSMGLKPECCYGIGIFSGIPGDPLAGICIPSELSDGDREALKKIELSHAESLADCGRYIYLSATVR